MPIKVWSFDLGQTLVEYDRRSFPELNRDALLAVHRALGLPGCARVFVERAASAVAAGVATARARGDGEGEADLTAILSRVLAAGGGLQQVAAAVYAYHEPWRRSRRPAAGAHRLLRWLRQRGAAVAVVSNSALPGRVLGEDLHALGLAEFVDLLVVSSDYRCRKPHPRIFRTVWDHFGAGPGEAVHTGDRLWEDVAGAQATGMYGVFRNAGTPDQRHGIHPDYVITELEELRRFACSLAAGVGASYHF